MKTPDNTPLYETELGTYWFGEDGILYCLSKSPVRTMENVKANIETIKRISNGKKPCLLIQISNSGKPDKATRDYVAGQLPHVYTAMAMVVSSALGKLIMNLIFGLSKPGIPMKTFSDEKKAKEWLIQFL